MSENDIIKITLVQNVQIINKHHEDFKPILQDIMIIDFRNGSQRYINMFSNVDETDIEYMTYEKTNKTKEKVIFYDEREDLLNS